MNNFKTLILSLIMASTIFCLSAQTDWFINYTFENYQDIYTEITGGTGHASGPNIDEQVYNNIALPFAKPGLYILKMHTNTGIYTTKLMIK